MVRYLIRGFLQPFLVRPHLMVFEKLAQSFCPTKTARTVEQTIVLNHLFKNRGT